MIKKMILIILFLLFTIETVFAWSVKGTHEKITENAINKSILDLYLKNNIGLINGILEPYNGSSIKKLVMVGSNNEDIPTRALNHFWNPLRNEGLDDSRTIYIYNPHLNKVGG